MTISTPLSKYLEQKGRLPLVSLEVTPLEGTAAVRFDKFVSYQFASNLLVPVDSFTFSFAAPSDPNSFRSYLREGAISTIYSADLPISTGIVDQIEIEVDGESGEKATVNGRDFLGQLEDNAAVSIDATPIWGGSMTLRQVAERLIRGTRIQDRGLQLLDVPEKPYLFASEPGESRLSALLRFLEPLNTLAWTNPTGGLVLGRPDFKSEPRASLTCSKAKRFSNVLSMRATFSATSIPNRVVVLWSDVQSTQVGLPKNQIFENPAEGPSRLKRYGHNVIKTVMTSIPSGADAQSLASAAAFQAASSASQTILQAQAKREIARANFNEVQVQCVVPGHTNEQGEPYLPNTVYTIDFDRAGISENMFLYSVEWNLSAERGQYTVLQFCRLGTIVSDAQVR